MLQDFCRFITEKKLFHSGDSVLAAVSGGVDSMVLIELLYRANFNFAVAHVNFELRGLESDGDEAMVSAWCKQREIPFFSRKIPPHQHQFQNNISLQIAARELRYNWFNELAELHNFNSILTAHHLDDQVETILMQLINGQLVTGMLGIPVVNGLVKRPLMFANRKQILEFAIEQKINWREDATNEKDAYIRNKIRHHVLPELKKINPALTETIRKGVWKARGVYELFRKGLDNNYRNLVVPESGFIKIRKDDLLKFKNPDSVLFHLLTDHGFTQDVCRRLVRESITHTGAVFYSENFELSVDREFLIIRQFTAADNLLKVEISDAGAFTLGSQMLTCSFDSPSIDRGSDCACLDLAKLDLPLTWRRWLPGDEFMPLGMSHHKKVSDFLIDEKIPLALKPGVSVLLSGNTVAWVVGFRISELYKISPSTDRIFRIRKTEILN